MDIKKLLRGPLPIILVLALLATLGISILRGASGYQTVDTGQVVKSISDGTIKSAEIRGGVDQTIRVVTTDDKKEQASWVTGQGRDLQIQLQKLADEGKLTGGYNVTNPQPSWFSTLLGSLLPLLLLVVVFILSLIHI